MSTDRPRDRSNDRRKIDLDPDIPAFQIQPEESSDAFGHFERFLALGPHRQVKEMARLTLRDRMAAEGKDPDADPAEFARRMESERVRISEKAAKYLWWVRAKAYDAYKSAERVRSEVEEQRKAVAKQAKSHAQLANGLLVLGQLGLRTFIDPTNPNNIKAKVEDMTVGELLSVIRQGIATDRLIHGMDSADEADRNSADPASPAARRPLFDDLKRAAREAAAEFAAERARGEAAEGADGVPETAGETAPETVVDNDPEA